MNEPLLTVDDVAAQLQCSPRKAREIVLRLPHVRVGKLLRLEPSVLQRWRDQGGDDYECPAALRSVSKAPAPRVRSARRRAPTLPPVSSMSELRVPVAKRMKRAA